MKKKEQFFLKKPRKKELILMSLNFSLMQNFMRRSKTLRHTENSSSKSKKWGNTEKCPACGAITKSFTTSCSHCGVEFRNVSASRRITEFFKQLDDLESSREESLFESQKPDFSLSFWKLVKWWFFWWILIPLHLGSFLLSRLKPVKWSTTDIRKEEFIMNFPISNSREEMIEFINLSVSKIQKIRVLTYFGEEGKYIAKWNSIWKKKAQQVYTKARISMIDDAQTIETLKQILVEANVMKK
jgi:hypothetical protein